MSKSIQAHELPNYIGQRVVGYGVVTTAGVVQPGGDIVVVTFGEGFGRREETFAPSDVVELEGNEQ